MQRIGVRLVAQLDAGERFAERRLRRCSLVRGGARFEVHDADRQNDVPSARARKRGELLKVVDVDHARGPRRPRRRRVGPGDARVGRDAAEAQQARPERAQHRHEVAAIGVARDLREARHLEGEAEEFAGNGRTGLRRVGGDRHERARLRRLGLRLRPRLRRRGDRRSADGAERARRGAREQCAERHRQQREHDAAPAPARAGRRRAVGWSWTDHRLA